MTFNDKDTAIGKDGRTYTINSENFAGAHGDKWYWLEYYVDNPVRTYNGSTRWIAIEDSFRRSKSAVKKFAEKYDQPKKDQVTPCNPQP